MLGDVKGYCTIKSYDDVFIGVSEDDYPELYADIKKSICAPMRIIDIAVDKSGFLCLEPKGRCLIDVRSMASVDKYFFCNELNNIIIPDCGENVARQMYECTLRMMRVPNYDIFTKAAVITKSLLEGKFCDSWLLYPEKAESAAVYEDVPQ